MRYAVPFTARQRAAALKTYRAFRGNVRLIRVAFPPRDKAERAMFTTYRRAVRLFGFELTRADNDIEPETLNTAGHVAVAAFTEYVGLRNESESL